MNNDLSLEPAMKNVSQNKSFSLLAVLSACGLCTLFGANAVAIKVSLTGLGTFTAAAVHRCDETFGDLLSRNSSCFGLGAGRGSHKRHTREWKREGSKDTSIYSRVLDHSNNSWSHISEVMTRQLVASETHRHIRKLGNPVALVKDDELWLFFVTVSVGGWAGSALNLSISEDNGLTWGPVKRLISSPFLNISTLVRNPALLADNGDVMLPAYHEFLGKFSELLQLDSVGNVINKYRISHGREAIQPALLAVDSTHVIAFMRNTSATYPGKLWFSHNRDNFADWSAIKPLTLPNPDSAATLVQLDSPDELLMVFNNHPSERDDITLGYRPSATAEWQLIHQFETREGSEDIHNPFSYPILLKTSSGDFHLFYTWKKQHIKHVYFNRAALLEMRAAAGSGS